jgi:hypothetical protein
MFRSFITLAAVAGLVAGASAQQTLPVGKVTNLSYGSYDFQNGFTQTSGNNNRAAGPDVLFDTMACAAYYYGNIGTAIGQEWLDEAQFADRGVSGVEEVNSVSWGYCDIGTAGYFDAAFRIYDDTVAFIGPSIWLNGVAAIPTCNLLIGGLPDGGCWYVTVDLSCGFECILPQAAGAGAQNTIGWSVTSQSASSVGGPILATQACAGPGTLDLFDWRDNSGVLGFGPYYHYGTFWFGGTPKARGDFLVGFTGSPEDTEGVYGTNGNDTLCLQAQTNAEPGASLAMTLEGADVATKSYRLLISTGSPAGVTMTNGNGSWTRQFNLGAALKKNSGFAGAGPVISVATTIPSIAPNDAKAVVQVVRLTGPGGLSAIDQASNGLAVRL